MGPLLLATERTDGGEFHLLDRPGHVRRQRRCLTQRRVARATVAGYRLGNTCPVVLVPEKCRGGSLDVPVTASRRRGAGGGRCRDDAIRRADRGDVQRCAVRLRRGGDRRCAGHRSAGGRGAQPLADRRAPGDSATAAAAGRGTRAGGSRARVRRGSRRLLLLLRCCSAFTAGLVRPRSAPAPVRAAQPPSAPAGRDAAGRSILRRSTRARGAARSRAAAVPRQRCSVPAAESRPRRQSDAANTVYTLRRDRRRWPIRCSWTARSRPSCRRARSSSPRSTNCRSI